MLSGQGALDAFESIRSLATSLVVTVIESICCSDFVVSDLGDPSSTVNMDLNWFDKD